LRNEGVARRSRASPLLSQNLQSRFHMTRRASSCPDFPRSCAEQLLTNEQKPTKKDGGSIDPPSSHEGILVN
ncbi:hypothetical protein, partial [Brevundimonas diminuta]|uniref:hypothetical protein n=1 Tax=Brevundimonas diminuta TaxID=293 RepID=UPI001C63C4A6